jgi:hypothetical protein
MLIKFRDFFFMIILLRCTGRVKRFHDSWYKTHQGGIGNILPSVEEWPAFIKFMRATCKKTLDQHVPGGVNNMAARYPMP